MWRGGAVACQDRAPGVTIPSTEEATLADEATDAKHGGRGTATMAGFKIHAQDALGKLGLTIRTGWSNINVPGFASRLQSPLGVPRVL